MYCCIVSKKSFSDIGLTKVLAPVLSSLSLERPSKIQAITFNTIFNGTSCIVADQTGSGKTLAYLLPVIQRVTDLKAAKLIGEPISRRPYIVIVAPTTELAK
jgi:ATP-dependent RNA helicase DDX18/HAS1